VKKILLVTFGLFGLSACESFTADRYRSSSQNQMVLEKISSKKQYAVDDFLVENKESISVSCRLAGPIQVPGAGDHANYIQEALEEELRLAGMYNKASSRKFSAEIKEIRVTTVAPASWDIAGDFYFNGGFVKSVKTSFPYKTSFSAMGACNNAAENFPYAVEEFLEEFIESAEFKKSL